MDSYRGTMLDKRTAQGIPIMHNGKHTWWSLHPLIGRTIYVNTINETDDTITVVLKKYP